MTRHAELMGERTRQDILKFIKDFTVTYRISPTMREIRRGTGLASDSTVKHHIDIMVSKGELIRHGDGKARNLAVPGGVLFYPDDN